MFGNDKCCGGRVAGLVPASTTVAQAAIRTGTLTCDVAG
jgi:hypothetical protein